ncbi:MAG: M20/M25/M40 family metallo-hydrolase [Synergistaceae bacterium]|jgi:arginine utilization protein RocB|nr:M20/M25/M40 family metallo-hydrolase [Synergistaceae bacterium]
MNETGRRIYELMLELVAIPSVTGSDGGENECARFIHDRLSRWDYFVRNPSDLRFVDAMDDPLGRMSVCALVRAGRPTKNTVILLGHFDVVDAEVCGPLRPWAFDPEEYTRRIGELRLSGEAKADLESGNYLFGRGVSDMKTGLAAGMCLLEEHAARSAEAEWNFMLLCAPDEEGDSVGMRGAISLLARLQEEDGLDFLACINTEPVFESSGPALFYGTVGKIMPVFLCVGRETHVGEYYEGLNSTLVASFLNVSLDGSEDTVERRGARILQPWSCLRMRDMRTHYTVTLPERTALYYNCLTLEKTPASVLEFMKGKAEKALRAALAHVGREDWTPRVLTVEELLNRAAAALAGSPGGSISSRDSAALQGLRERLFQEIPLSASDARERGIEFLSGALDLAGEKGPLVVVGFVPPFYPPRSNGSRNPHERAVREAAAVIRGELEGLGFALKEVEIFQGITDLSYTGFEGRVEDLAPLAANFPLWGRGYGLPLEDLQKIDIPPVILGPIGRDAHKITERVELNYSFNVLPSILRTFISSIVRCHDPKGGNSAS